MFALDIVILSFLGGLINRARGWGDGWGGSQKPVWLLWVQKHILTRHWMALATGALLGYTLHTHSIPYAALYAIGFGLAWWYAVAFGWGEYFDGLIYQNNEIKWIDDFVVWLARYVPPKWGMNAPLIDNFSMGLRGLFYLPLFAFLAIHAGWWALLPALLFWQDGIVYGFWRWLNPNKDFVARSELFGGALRVFLMVTALNYGLQ